MKRLGLPNARGGSKARRKGTALPAMPYRVMCTVLAVVFALGMSPTVGLARGTDEAPDVDLGLTTDVQPAGDASEAVDDAATPDVSQDVAATLRDTLDAIALEAQADYRPYDYDVKDNYIWLEDEAGNKVSEVHTTGTYTIATSGEEEIYGQVRLSPAPNGGSPDEQNALGVNNDFAWDGGDNDPLITLLNGLYTDLYGGTEAPMTYKSALTAVSSGWYRLAVSENPSWASDGYIHVIDDGNFVSDEYMLDESTYLWGSSKAYNYQEGLSDIDYDGTVDVSDPDHPATVPGIATEATVINQSDHVRINTTLGILSDIVDGKDVNKSVHLDQVVLYKSDSATMADLRTRIDELANDADDDNNLDYLPSKTTFADESKRALAWSRDDGEDLAWHVKDEAGPRIAISYGNPNVYDVEEQYALVLDDMSFENAVIDTGVYFPLVVLEMNGEQFTYVCAPLEITASGDAPYRDPAITTASVPDGMLGHEYAAQLESRSGLGAFSADASRTWSVASGALPDGLKLNSSTGAIAGTPTKAGDYSFTIAFAEKANAVDPGRTATHHYQVTIGTNIEIGDVHYQAGTYWMDRGSTVHMEAPLNVDFEKAGLSNSMVRVEFRELRADGTEREVTYNIDHSHAIFTPWGLYANADYCLDAAASPDSRDLNLAAITGFTIRIELIDDNGNPIMEGPAGDQHPAVVTKSVDVDDIILGSYVRFPELSYAGDVSEWPCTEASAQLWQVDSNGRAISGVRTIDLTSTYDFYYGNEGLGCWLEPGTYRFTVQGDFADGAGNMARLDIAEDMKGAHRVWGASPATYEFTVGQNEMNDLEYTYGGQGYVNRYVATVTFEGGKGEFYGSNVAWYRKDGGNYYLLGAGDQMTLLTTAEGANPEIYVKVTPTGTADTVFYATDYVKVEGKFVSVTLKRKPTFNVSLKVRCETGWEPAEGWWDGKAKGEWGTMRVLKPRADGTYEASDTQWIYQNNIKLAGITPGTRVILTPKTASLCRSYTYEVPANQTANITDVVTAPTAKGIVRFSQMDFVSPDRLYDPVTGDDYTKDDDPATRTGTFSFNSNGTRVRAFDAAGKEVPVYVFDSRGLAIQDDDAKMVKGAKYTLVIDVYDSSFSAFGHLGEPLSYASTVSKTVTLDDVEDDLAPNGRIGATGVEVTAPSRGRAVIHYTNPNQAPTELLIYNADTGALVDESYVYGNREDNVLETSYLNQGGYTLYAVNKSLFSSKTKPNGDEPAPSYATIAGFEALGFENSDFRRLDFTVENNKLKEIGIKNPLVLPQVQHDDLIDLAQSGVTASSSYSNYVTITIDAVLNTDADADLLAQLGQRDQYYSPKLLIYTNQKQPDTGQNSWVWPRSLSFNGKSVALNRFENAGNMDMLDGWLELDLLDICPGYTGAESYPLHCSLTVPRTDTEHTQVAAYLELRGGNIHLVGSYDQSVQDITLAAPEVTSEKTFTAHGYTAAKADVTFYLDGVEISTVKADEYGFYTSEITLPDDAEDYQIFDIQATATWSREGVQHTAASEVLDVTYSISKASLKRIWLLWQNGAFGDYNYMLIYDNGDWPSLYLSYYLAGDWGTRRFCWLAEFENADYAKNVRTIVPRSEGDLELPMTQSYDEFEEWNHTEFPNGMWKPLVHFAGSADVSTQSLDTQSAISLETMAANGIGRIGYTEGKAFISDRLACGDSFVSKPTALACAPSDVYVTWDDVERQILDPMEPFTGYSGIDENDMADFIYWLNEKSTNMLIVEKDLAPDGQLVKVEPLQAAERYVNAPEGQVDEWIAIAFDLDPASTQNEDSTPSLAAEPVWMQLHHTVETTKVDMSEPLDLIHQAQGKYDEYLANIKKYAEEAVTYCPCKESDNAHGGVPIEEMFVRSDESLESLRYFIWTEDSNRNTFIRTMEKFEVAGTGDVVYRQYAVDERQLEITEWNSNTGQKTVITYTISDSFIENLGEVQEGISTGLHDTDFAFLNIFWSYVGLQVQLGTNDAEAALVEQGHLNPGDVSIHNQFNLTTQDDPKHYYLDYGDNMVENIVIGAGNATCWTFNTIGDGLKGAYNATDKWVSQQLDWRMNLLKSSGLAIDWGELSDDELKSIFKFIADNNGCFKEQCIIEKSSRKKDWVSPFGDISSKAFRGGLAKVYKSLDSSTGIGKSILKDGVRKTVEGNLKSTAKSKTKQGIQNAARGKKNKQNNASAHSQEYYLIVDMLVRFEREMSLKDPNCIKWDAIDPYLLYNMKYAKDKQAQRLKNRKPSNGSRGPKGKTDPSGFVYEAVLSNPVQGATVELFTFNQAGDPDNDHATFVDSEKFGYEENPQVTGVDGRYQWFVSSGYWQVRVTKVGYQPVSTGDSDAYGIGATKTLTFDEFGNATAVEKEIATRVDATTYWMPVLPEQLDVNIPLVSKEAPTVASMEATEDGIVVEFSKYVDVTTVDAAMFSVGKGSDTPATTSVEPVNADDAADGSGKVLASKFLVAYPEGSGLSVGDNSYTVEFNDAAGKVTSYAGTPIDVSSRSVSQTVDCNVAPTPIDGAVVTLAETEYIYDGTAKKPAVTVALDGKVLRAGTDYTVKYANNTNAGTATATATGTGAYGGSASAMFTIAKAANPLTVTAVKRAATYKTSKQTVARPLAVKGAQGAVTYKLAKAVKGTKAVKYFTVSKKTGKVTAKAKTPAGTYKLTIKTTAAGNDNYGAKSVKKTATLVVGKAKAKAAPTAKAYKVAQLKKKAQSFSIKPTTDGKAAYKVAKKDPKGKLSFKSGKVAVKKGTPKGTYYMKVRISAKAGANYKALKAKTYTVRVSVR